MHMMVAEADQPAVPPASAPTRPIADGRPASLLPMGRLRDGSIPDGDRKMAIAMHLTPLAALLLLPIWGPIGFIAPLVLWLVRKDVSTFVDDHGREVLNFCLSCLIWSAVLAITIIGIPVVVILVVVMIVSMIRGASAAGRREYFRYPVTIRFL